MNERVTAFISRRNTQKAPSLVCAAAAASFASTRLSDSHHCLHEKRMCLHIEQLDVYGAAGEQ